jgi:hypothetical protein
MTRSLKSGFDLNSLTAWGKRYSSGDFPVGGKAKKRFPFPGESARHDVVSPLTCRQLATILAAAPANSAQ